MFQGVDNPKSREGRIPGDIDTALDEVGRRVEEQIICGNCKKPMSKGAGKLVCSICNESFVETK